MQTLSHKLKKESGWLLIKVIPYSHKQSIIKISDDAFKIKLKSVPEKGKANKELIKLLAQYFAISKNQVKIVRGQKSRNKIISIFIK